MTTRPKPFARKTTGGYAPSVRAQTLLLSSLDASSDEEQDKSKRQKLMTLIDDKGNYQSTLWKRYRIYSQQGHEEQAKKALQKIEQVDNDIDDIYESIFRLNKDDDDDTKKKRVEFEK